jgi:hypothetical protein
MMIEFYTTEFKAAIHDRDLHIGMIMAYTFRTRVAQDAGHRAPGDRYSQKMRELDIDIGEAERVIATLKKLKIGG